MFSHTGFFVSWWKQTTNQALSH